MEHKNRYQDIISGHGFRRVDPPVKASDYDNLNWHGRFNWRCALLRYAINRFRFCGENFVSKHCIKRLVSESINNQ